MWSHRKKPSHPASSASCANSANRRASLSLPTGQIIPARLGFPPTRKRRSRQPKKTAPPPGPFDECQAKQAVWLYFRSPEKLTPAEQEELSFLQQVHPSLETAYRLVQEFVDMVRKREGEGLEAWLEQIRQCVLHYA